MRIPTGIQDEMAQLRNENGQLQNEIRLLRNSNSALTLNLAPDSTKEVGLVEATAEATHPASVLRPEDIGEQAGDLAPPPIHDTGPP